MQCKPDGLRYKNANLYESKEIVFLNFLIISNAALKSDFVICRKEKIPAARSPSLNNTTGKSGWSKKQGRYN